jgi:hypothetical protein
MFELDKNKFNFPPIGMDKEWLDKKIKLSKEVDYSGYSEPISINNPMINIMEDYNTKKSKILRSELEGKMIGYDIVGDYISSSTNPDVYDMTISRYKIKKTCYYDLRETIDDVVTIHIVLPDNITDIEYSFVKRTILDELNLLFRFPQNVMELVYKELSKENYNNPMNLDVMVVKDKTMYVINVRNIKTGKAVNFIKSLLRRHCKRNKYPRHISGCVRDGRNLTTMEKAICELYSTAYIQTLRGVNNGF